MITKIDDRIKNIFIDIFEVEDIKLDITYNDIDLWDSINHVKMIVAIEKEFHIRFKFSEVTIMTSVKSIHEVLKSKGLL